MYYIVKISLYLCYWNLLVKNYVILLKLFTLFYYEYNKKN
ncbi:hypothetical protein A1OE_1328 [Candidatus Endolissoclinum faulkneri L2]|uniref:Uncharacterized protein n=1 Tax=Candidatus Endolissoclinum faulkneri L2 TaxID=1193729 RepID=K7ZDG5_9PROT|nr:hypothetical protein A1OE_1328 [Candidatus Endolissoclinum faulkneri L2]